MNRKTLDELASGHALGALEPDEARQVKELLTHDAEVRREVAAFIDTAAAIAAAASPRVTPSAEQRARILAAVKATPQKLPDISPLTELPAGYRLMAHSKEGWEESEVPGFRTKMLSTGPHPGYRMMLVSFDPGTTYGDHEHDGIEELYMISGNLQTEGRLLGPGDFMRGEMGTHHHESYSPDGCVALLICRPALVA
ncbi:MAG: cupin domain-containing protein [Verrucomicrobia bacterium]|nr:cupin domain-containing protein [Verrucomicrobiota bacterium]